LIYTRNTSCDNFVIWLELKPKYRWDLHFTLKCVFYSLGILFINVMLYIREIWIWLENVDDTASTLKHELLFELMFCV